MTVCADVYVRPQTCTSISIYPSQVHPTPPPISVRPGGPARRVKVEYPDVRPVLQDDDVAIAIALLDLL